ncbi:MAG: GreA/GreB family elongation factor [Acidobacteriota bacterium]
MAVSRNTRGQIEKGDFSALEDDWLARVEEDPTDLDYFVGAARALGGTGQDDRSRVLLGVLDEQLRERESWGLRLELLRLAGHLMFATGDIHPHIMETLAKIYPDGEALSAMANSVALDKATQDIPKSWEKVERLQALMRFEQGTIVAMEGKGVGRIAEVNFALSTFKVDFDRISGVPVGFRAAPKLLESLPEGHILRRKLEDPKGLRAAAKDDPPQVLRALLESHDRPLKAGDIRKGLTGIVKDSEWTSWWSAARKHPQVLAGPKQTYSWAESSDDAVDAVWRSFEGAKTRARMAMLRRDGARDEDLKARMGAELAKSAVEALVSDPGLTFEIWHALERAGLPTEDLHFSPDGLMRETKNIPGFLAGIEDRALREEAYRLLADRRDDAQGHLLDRLSQEDDPRAIDVLIDLVGGTSKLDRFLDGTLALPHRAPGAFTWIAERAAEDETLRDRNPLRLLQQILVYLGRDELAPFRQRLQRLIERGGTVSKLMAVLSPDQAPAAADAIDRAGTLEPYEREELMTALELRFPTLRKDEAASSGLYATSESIAAKREEFDELMKVEIPANREAIAEARAMGDLRENFEYKSARQRHEYLNARAAQLNQELSQVQPIDFDRIDPSQVRVGTRVRLEAADGGERELVILGPWESDPDGGVISYESDLAAALLGKAVGDTAEVAGETVTVAAIALAR